MLKLTAENHFLFKGRIPEFLALIAVKILFGYFLENNQKDCSGKQDLFF
jgi:hypothetical protein